MKSVSFGTAVIGVLFALSAHAADQAPLHRADKILVDAKGMTVYTYDKDASGSGKSTCTGQCAENWPPVKAEGKDFSDPYAALTRDDGSKQLSYKGRPLYTFVKDKKPGDKTGDKVKDVWHVIRD
jgi:predicted lipoprotein with Yx(FWY)xxD motif